MLMARMPKPSPPKWPRNCGILQKVKELFGKKTAFSLVALILNE